TSAVSATGATRAPVGLFGSQRKTRRGASVAIRRSSSRAGTRKEGALARSSSTNAPRERASRAYSPYVGPMTSARSPGSRSAAARRRPSVAPAVRTAWSLRMPDARASRRVALSCERSAYVSYRADATAARTPAGTPHGLRFALKSSQPRGAPPCSTGATRRSPIAPRHSQERDRRHGRPGQRERARAAHVARGGHALAAETIVSGLLQPDTARACGRGHRPARVRALRARVLAPRAAQRLASAEPDERRGDGERERREPRGHEIEHVVETRGGLPQMFVWSVVADHRVRGIHRAICERRWQTAEAVPEQRRDIRIAEVLRERLDHRRRDVRRIELACRAAHERPQMRARAGDVARLEVVRDRIPRHDQTTQRERRLQKPERGERPEHAWTQTTDRDAASGRGDRRARDEQRTVRELRRRRARRDRLELGDRPPEEHDGMDRG